MMIADCEVKLDSRKRHCSRCAKPQRSPRRARCTADRRLVDDAWQITAAIEEYQAFLRRPEFYKEHPELTSLIEKGPGVNPEALAKQIQTMVASISAARRSEREGQSRAPAGAPDADAWEDEATRILKRFGRLGLQQGGKIGLRLRAR
jgi:hypothetical protein